MADGIRLEAACALTRSPHSEAKKLLLSMWNDPYFGVRITVLHAGQDGFRGIVGGASEDAQDPDDRVRNEALRYLGLASKGPQGGET